MSKRVYVSRDISVTTAQEDTPVSLRIQVSAATVKALHARLQQAYLKDDVRLVRRTTVLIDLLVHHVPLAVLCERWGLGASCLYDWQKAFPDSTGFSGKKLKPLILLKLFYNHSDVQAWFKRRGAQVLMV